MTNYSNILLVVLTVVLVVLTTVLAFLAYGQFNESQNTSKILKELEKSNKLLLASLYSDFELELLYEIYPPKLGRAGGVPYDMFVYYNGALDAIIDSQWYVTVACNENDVLTYFNRTEAISNARNESDEFFASEIDPPKENYLLQIHHIYPNHTNFKPFEMELVVIGQPITPDGNTVEFSIPKKKIARIQFTYNEELNNWIPNATWEELNCKGKPREGSSFIRMETTNSEQFHGL